MTITGEGLTETVFTLEDLKTKFESVDITTVIQCNGNRREDFHYVDGETPAFGPPHWVAGANGNSTWSGPRYFYLAYIIISLKSGFRLSS